MNSFHDFKVHWQNTETGLGVEHPNKALILPWLFQNFQSLMFSCLWKFLGFITNYTNYFFDCLKGQVAKYVAGSSREWGPGRHGFSSAPLDFLAKQHMTAANLPTLEAVQLVICPVGYSLRNGCQQCTQRKLKRHLEAETGNCSQPRCSHLDSHWSAWTWVFLACTGLIYG